MTFDEFIQDGLGKADKLFDKLAQTGPNAIKTRDRLFSDLKAELSHLSRFERNHLIPALGDQRKTRPMVKALEKDSEKVADLLSELDTAPRAGDSFLEMLSQLRATFQAHVRNERKTLLPAVLEALHRAQQAEQAAATQDSTTQDAMAQDAMAQDATGLEAAELKAAEPEAAKPGAAGLKPPPADSEAEAAATAASEPAPVAAQPDEPPRAPLPIPAPLAAIAVLQTIAPPLAPPAPLPFDLPKPVALPLPTPAYGVQAWANLMQEATAGAMLGYRLMLAYSSNTGFAALQTRLMKEQIELMTKSGAKMVEAAQRFARTAG